MKGYLRKFAGVTEAASQLTAASTASFVDANGQKLTKAVVVATLGAVALSSTGAMALVAPVAGSFAYDMYDIGVNQILNGAPGFIGGVCGIVYSATLINKNWIAAALGILACTAVLRADTITTSLGAII